MVPIVSLTIWNHAARIAHAAPSGLQARVNNSASWLLAPHGCATKPVALA